MRIATFTLIFFAGWAMGHHRSFLSILLLIAGGATWYLVDTASPKLQHEASIVAILALFAAMLFL